ncbi:unnamed protein product [Mesocestoides corti]|uniref:ANK_REP_REGION domain-containing protein n=1 Tax=Mesocestoides corti TaxID=53468 RepID=A0A158QUR8_MESCO|nr:unnamed protein product [Mesocestoides corti]
MSSDSDSDLPPELRYSTEEVMRAKERNPGMFVSAWQADEEDIDYWSKKELKKDSKKQFILAGQKGDLATMQRILKTEVGENLDEKKAELVEFLFAHDSDGYTALHRAVYSGQYDAAKFLLQLGAKTETHTADGWRPLHSAAFWNQLACVQLLLEAGADITAVTSSGQTVLHLALANNQTPETLVYLLAEISANRDTMRLWNSRNSAGDTPVEMLLRSSPLAPFLLHSFSPEATQLRPEQ